jgi:predicted exporter
MLALCSATTILAFGLLAFSAAPVLHAIGLTVAIGATCCLVFSALTARAEVAS